MLALWVAAWQATLPQIDFAARAGWLAARLDELEAGGAVTRLAFAGEQDGAEPGRRAARPAAAGTAGRDGSQAVGEAAEEGDGLSLAGFVVVSPATGYLDQLVVGPRWFGAGVAAALLAEARRLSPHRLELHVNQDNPRAVRFYEREGFVRTGEGTNPRSGLPIWRYEWQGEAAP
ncbi:GNAT family N-acetyltransferase [Ancylobacter lacus]|uniref:GNAT family N-acetyltransferase n=1 Tax=Ancylobacter lacus TaxID=2579970 RepID=UPI001BD19C0E|nr:GNAT family N-acetyltransferase [Ancylobacter lacus]MBS7540199.1 GNAT family N-acetyltransferase [Ancylobacter lacus]